MSTEPTPPPTTLPPQAVIPPADDTTWDECLALMTHFGWDQATAEASCATEYVAPTAAPVAVVQTPAPTALPETGVATDGALLGSVLLVAGLLCARLARR